MGKELTLRRQRLLDELVSGRARTQREAGIRAGFSPHSVDEMVSEILRFPQVRDELDKRLSRKRDSARALVGRVERLYRRALAALEQLDPETLQLAEVAALTKMLGELRTQELKVRAEFPPEDEAGFQQQADEHARYVRRVVLWALDAADRFGAGKVRRGRRPPSPPPSRAHGAALNRIGRQRRGIKAESTGSET